MALLERHPHHSSSNGRPCGFKKLVNLRVLCDVDQYIDIARRELRNNNQMLSYILHHYALLLFFRVSHKPWCVAISIARNPRFGFARQPHLRPVKAD